MVSLLSHFRNLSSRKHTHFSLFLKKYRNHSRNPKNTNRKTVMGLLQGKRTFCIRPTRFSVHTKSRPYTHTRKPNRSLCSPPPSPPPSLPPTPPPPPHRIACGRFGSTFATYNQFLEFTESPENGGYSFDSRWSICFLMGVLMYFFITGSRGFMAK